jgi:16S rRNA (guanine527-N7)-methyltransferase
LNELSEIKPTSALNRTELADLTNRLAEKGLLLNNQQQEQLWTYAELLLDWNKKVNLISRKDEDAVLTKHVLHALSLALFHSFKSKERVLDLGTGGGLPGIPLAIAFPDTYFLLIDSIGKKINACSDMIQKLELKNVLAQKSRSDELKNVKFDVIVSRQVAAMPELCAWCRPLLKKGGKLLCLKGGDLEEEIGQALIEGAEKLAFPEHIEQHPIDFLGEKFKEKCVVIAV